MTFEEARDRLIVVDPPYATIGWILSLVALLLLIAAWYSRGHQAGRWWVFLVLTMPCAVLAVALAGSWTEMLFEGQQITIREVRGFVMRRTRTAPLASVDQALVGRGRKTIGLVLRFHSGERYIPGSFNDRGGQVEAVEAINRYLATHRPQN